MAAAGCAFAEALLRYRHYCYLLAVLDHWIDRIHLKDGRVHPHYFQIPSTNGRMSCKDPNAQQIPRAGEGAMAVRRLILLEVQAERAEEYARLLKEIMERVGSQLLHPVPVKAEVKIMRSLQDSL